MADRMKGKLDRPEQPRPPRLTPGLLLWLGVALTVAGMVLVVLGVLIGTLFLPGVIVLTVGLLICAAAGILYTLPRYATS